jgi:hypothetical protein
MQGQGAREDVHRVERASIRDRFAARRHRAVEREWERRIHARTRERKLSQLI